MGIFSSIIGLGTKSNGGGGNNFSTLVNGATKPLKASTSLATGLFQSIQAAKLKKKADAAFPELVDPNQAGFLAELNQKRKSIDTGADFAAGMQAIDTTNAGTDNAIVQNAGGDSGGAIQALLQSERTANEGKNQVLAQGQQQQMNYTGMYGQLQDKLAARKMQLQLLRSQQLRAEWDHKAKLASSNLQAGVAGLMPGGNTNPQQATQLTDGGGPAGSTQAAGLPASNWDFVGAQKTAPPANPNPTPPTSIETTGASVPTVTPQQTQTTKGLGTVMDLIKR